MSRERVSAVVLSFVLVVSAMTIAIPASAFTPDGTIGAVGNPAEDTSGNDTTTLVETTTTVGNHETTTVTETTTTVAETTTSEPTKDPGPPTEKSNPKISSSLLDRVDSTETKTADGYTYQWTLEADSDGSYAVELGDVEDTHGNAVERNWTETTTVDTHAPNVTDWTVTEPGDDRKVADGDQVSVTLDLSDGLSEVQQVTVDAAEFGAGSVALTETSPGTFEGSFTVDAAAVTDGGHDLRATATDTEGNEAGPVMFVQMELDSHALNTNATLVGTPSESGWYTSDVTVTLDASDEPSGVAETKYRVDGGTWQTYDGSFTVSGDGEHIVEFYSVDVAGNRETTHNETIKIDTTEPKIVDPPGLNDTDEVLPERAIRVVVDATDEHSRVDEILVDGVPVGADGNGSVPAAPALGNHKFEVVVTDAAGNKFVLSNESTAYSVGERVEMKKKNDTLAAETNDTNVGEVAIETKNETSEANLTVGTVKTNPEPERGEPDGTSLYFPQIDTSVSNDDIENATVTVTVEQSRVRERYIELNPESLNF
jgi:hypothetical protein